MLMGGTSSASRVTQPSPFFEVGYSMNRIQLSSPVYKQVVNYAAERQITPDAFVEAMLIAQLRPTHPYVEMIPGRSEARAVIKGTRVGVDVIAGYAQAGYSPHEIAADILPQLNLAQIYDALSYCEDHSAQMEQIQQSHTPEEWRLQLKQRLGKQSAAQLLGEV